MNPIWEKEEDLLEKEQTVNTSVLMLYNDPINTFDWVIKCLMKYCKHQQEQAHQVALIVHTKGLCDIKHGSYKELRPIYDALVDAKLSVKIEI